MGYYEMASISILH